MRTPTMIAIALLLALLAACAAVPANSATSGTVVGATVPSATSLSTLGCAGGAAGVTDFGNVTPGSFTRTPTDCVVQFGSSNDAARLLAFQGDGVGDALAKATAGAYDLAFDGNAGTGNGSVAEPTAGDAVSIYHDPHVVTDPSTGAIYGVRPVVSGGWGAILVTRMLPTGVLDTAWDGPSGTGNGIVTYDLAASTNEIPQAALVQPDGKLVVGWHTSSGYWVSRFTSTGLPDPSFGTGGTKFIYLDPGDGDLRDITIDPSGRIYVVGFRNTPALDVYVVRLRDDGSFDPTWGSGGVTAVNIGQGDYAGHAAIQPDGKLLVGGYNWSGDKKFSMYRFTTSGALDVTFDGASGVGNGFVSIVTTPGFDTDPEDMQVMPDGRIVMAGWSANGTAALMRTDSNGVLDPTFDGPSGTGNGLVFLTQGTAAKIRSILVDPDGTITFGGSYTSGDIDSWFGRLTPTGAWDTSFDGPSGTGDGNVTIDTAPGATDRSWSITRATDGDVVSLGIEGASNTARFLRFDTTTVPDYVNGSADWSAGAGGAFGVCLSTLTGTGASTTSAWTPDARCTNMGDSTSGTWWDDVPDGPSDPDAQVGSLGSTATNGEARFRFGLRVPTNQAPGRYLAPITFQVLAP